LAATVLLIAIRSWGFGWVLVDGLLVMVVAVFAASASFDRGGPPAYFALWSVLMLLVLVALACIRRHVPGTAASFGR
jgi:hypothetical protein